MWRSLCIGLLILPFTACDSDDSSTGIGDDAPDLVDLDGDGRDDRDMQFLLDLVANNPDRDLDAIEIGDQIWEEGRLVSIHTWSNGPRRVEDLAGPLPGSLGFLTRARTIALTEQDFHGEIPPAVGNLSTVETLHLSGSRFSGSIPPELARLPMLRTLNLADNQLSGAIPVELAQLPDLRKLNLSWNQLTGEIPPSIAAMPLETLDLQSNQLTGPIPEFNFERLGFLVLSDNQLSGEPLAQIVDAPELHTLHLARNDFEGHFLPELIDVSIYDIDIDLAGNGFEGVIPAEVCGHFEWDGMLREYSRLAGNRFCPPWPPCLEPWQIGDQDCEETR